MSNNQDPKDNQLPEDESFFHGATPDSKDWARSDLDGSEQAPRESDPMGIERRVQDRGRSKRWRYVLLAGMFTALSLMLAYLLRDDLFYFFRSAAPVDLGEAEDLTVAPLEHNSFVKVRGIARDMCIRAELFSNKVRFLYLLGSEMGGRILIQLSVGNESGCMGAEDRVFEGRVIDLATTNRFNSVLQYYREHFPAAPNSGAMYLIESGDLPQKSWWYPVMFLILLIMVAFNVRVLWRMFRRPAPDTSEGESA